MLPRAKHMFGFQMLVLFNSLDKFSSCENKHSGFPDSRQHTLIIDTLKENTPATLTNNLGRFWGNCSLQVPYRFPQGSPGFYYHLKICSRLCKATPKPPAQATEQRAGCSLGHLLSLVKGFKSQPATAAAAAAFLSYPPNHLSLLFLYFLFRTDLYPRLLVDWCLPRKELAETTTSGVTQSLYSLLPPCRCPTPVVLSPCRDSR